MFCANCGSQIQAELNFCSRCGTKVSKIDSEMQKSVADNLASSLGYIGGFGLTGFVFLVWILVTNSVKGPDLIFITFFYLAALFGVCFLILQQIKRSSEKSAAKTIDLQNDFQINQIGAVDTARLAEAKPAPISVTENTTRTLEEVLVEKR